MMVIAECHFELHGFDLVVLIFFLQHCLRIFHASADMVSWGKLQSALTVTPLLSTTFMSLIMIIILALRMFLGDCMKQAPGMSSVCLSAVYIHTDYPLQV